MANNLPTPARVTSVCRHYFEQGNGSTTEVGMSCSTPASHEQAYVRHLTNVQDDLIPIELGWLEGRRHAFVFKSSPANLASGSILLGEDVSLVLRPGHTQYLEIEGDCVVQLISGDFDISIDVSVHVFPLPNDEAD